MKILKFILVLFFIICPVIINGDADLMTVCRHDKKTDIWSTVTINKTDFKNSEYYIGSCTIEPTPVPVRSPTFRPTKKGRTNRPTRAPTSRPTRTPPTPRPTFRPTSTCPQSVVQIAIDRSKSIDNREMTRQKNVIDSLVSKLDINPNAMSVGVLSFALRYYEDIEVTSDRDTAINNINSFLAKRQKKQFYTDYIPIFRHAQDTLPSDSTIVIVSDGKPYSKKYRGSHKSTIESCKAREELRRSHPDIKVLCFQSTRFSKATPFFNCACDAVWLQTEHKGMEEFVADQMKNFVCNQFQKKRNPCRCIDDRDDCRNVLRTNTGDDSVTIFERVSPHCFWDGEFCRVKPEFKELYD